MSKSNVAPVSPDTDPILDRMGAPSTSAEDPFNLSNLRLSQDFVETAGVKKLLTTVPVRRPHSQDFVRVHPDPNYRMTFAVIDLKDDREIYLLPPAIAQQLPGEFVTITLSRLIGKGWCSSGRFAFPRRTAGSTSGIDLLLRRPS
jgi:hypothetical protein